MGNGFSSTSKPKRSAKQADRFFDRAVHALTRSDQAAALNTLRAALAANPNHVPSLNELGAIQLSGGDVDAALRTFERALSSAEGHLRPQVLNNLACALLECGRYGEALRRVDEALADAHGYVPAVRQRGMVLHAMGQLPAAKGELLRSLTLQPADPKALVCLALVHQECDELEAALACAHQALALAPDDHNSRWLLATLLLACGRGQEAWPLFESRLFAENAVGMYAYPDLEVWTPASQEAPATLLVVAEQGLGDCLMWMRFLPLLRARCRRLELCGPPTLQPLVEDLGIVDRFLVPEALADATAERFLPLLSLGLALPDLLNEAAACLRGLGYQPPPQQIAHWRQLRQATGDGLLVGLHWQGNPQAEDRSQLRGRSIPLDQLRPLQQLPGCQWVSLQYGPGVEQISPADRQDWLVPWQDQVDQAPGLVDRGALLAACDLLVTTDSMVAHLAGLVGTPTLLLLHHCPEWRWRPGACPGLYSNHHLLRQGAPGDWQPVVAEVAARISHWPMGG
jgi:Tfp pilus assembly protein PilF